MDRSLQHPPEMFCDFDIYQPGRPLLQERRREVTQHHHRGNIFELSSPDGINLGYYNIQSSQPGKVMIKNSHPFIQLSYSLSGNKMYRVQGDRFKQASFAFKKQEYNYLFLPKEEIELAWEPTERLEIFELGISPELMVKYLPEEHAFFDMLQKNLEDNKLAAMSRANMLIPPKSSNILYEMLHCPLEGRYKRLYIQSKVGELLALELEAYEQKANIRVVTKHSRIKPTDVERMHQVRDIILSNLQSPCSLIDLAHQVGTNDAYLKRYFKEVFGTTVFGYLHTVKMEAAKVMLLAGKNVSEAAAFTGYKYVAHFTRAFKKHFGMNPTKIKE